MIRPQSLHLQATITLDELLVATNKTQRHRVGREVQISGPVVMSENTLSYGSLSQALAAELDCSLEDVEARRNLGSRCTAYFCRGGLVLVIQVQPDERLAPIETYHGVTREDFDRAAIEAT